MGASDASLRRLHAQGKLEQGIDLMFLDHYKPAYTTDLKLCEQLGLVRPGSVLAADNVIKPGNPPYLEYVRSSVDEKKAALAAADGNSVQARFTDRYAKQYQKREGDEHLDVGVQGDPHLVYKSELVNSWEPTGVPVRHKNFPMSVMCVWAVFFANVDCITTGWHRDYEMCWP